MKYGILAVLLFTLCAATTKSCSNNSSDNPCAEDMLCTTEFVMLQVPIVNNEGELIQLDSTFTSRQKGGEVIFSAKNDGSNSQYGYHIVITDGAESLLDFNGENLIFRGWLNGRLVVSEQFKVAGGCCHISPLEGPEEIQL